MQANVIDCKAMKVNGANIKGLLDRGAATQIAKKLGITPQAVGLALKAGKPNSPSVREALRMIQESGALEAAHTLASLNQAA